MKIENIKFKAKELGTGEWKVGFLQRDMDYNLCILIANKEDHSWYWSQIDPSTVSQFTGEKDMNGDEIYIGDIISNLETGSVAEVTWNDRLKRLDCKFLNADKGLEVPWGIFVSRYKRIVVLMSKFDKKE